MDLSPSQSIVGSPTFMADSPLSYLSRDRRGLLPLKKRRLLSLYCNESTSVVESSPRIGSEPQSSTSSKDEKMAALALIGASSAGMDSSSSSSAHIVSSSSTADAFISQSDVSTSSGPCMPVLQTTTIISGSSAERKISEDTAASLNHHDEYGQLKNGQSDKGSSSRNRANHPPLTAPIPGGCHGRTSRNNSYCRRVPCYNGTQYCKLHYQQFVINAATSNSSITSDPVAQASSSSASGTKRTAKAAGTPAKGCPTARAPNQQDRRYTDEDPPETRCQATTTRGRPCAFVSVVDKKYCHLHANYDTDPPPKRCGFAVGSAPASPGKGIAAHSLSTQAIDTPKKAKSSKVAVTTSNEDDFSEHLPLLNSIPSDQWSNKLVQMAIGPFQGEKGTIMKWGNGWVTCRLLPSIPVESTARRNMDGEGVLHNRRAMELYLLPGEVQEEEKKQAAVDNAKDQKISKRASEESDHLTVAESGPLSPRSRRSIHRPKRYDSDEDGDSSTSGSGKTGPPSKRKKKDDTSGSVSSGGGACIGSPKGN